MFRWMKWVLVVGVVQGYAGLEERAFFVGSPFAQQEIEVAVVRPEKEEFPVLLLLHGASGKGLAGISSFWAEHWVSKGYGVAAISLPGYGKSTGRKDFCGKFTMRSLDFALDAIKKELGVKEVGIYGFGQGGVAALLLAMQRGDIACVVCSNGAYDLFRHKVPGDLFMQTLVEKSYDIDMHDDAELASRSVMSHVASLNIPVFLVHRKGSPVIHESEAVDFHRAMIAAGKECHLRIKEEAPAGQDRQILTDQEVLEDTEEWFDKLMNK